MDKILITAIGDRDPYIEGDGKGPILTAVDELKPNEVYLVYTAPPAKSHKEEEAFKTRDVLLSEYKVKSYLRQVLLPDPTDYDAVLNEFRRVSEEIRELPLGKEIAVSVSSGTPTMQACWLLLISQGLLPAIPYYISDPKFVEAGQPRIRQVSVDFLREDSLMKTARQHYRTFSFYSAEQVLMELSQCCSIPDRRVGANWLAQYCRILGLWDGYRLDEATGRMRRFVKESRGLGWEKFTEPQLEVLMQLWEDQKSCEYMETSLILTDLYFNAERCLQRGHYADTLARAWRTYEGALRWWLFNTHGIPAMTTKFPENRSQELLEFLAKNSIYSGKNGELNRHALETILVEFVQDQKVKSWKDGLGGFGDARNKSIIAHGTQEINEGTAQKALKRLRQVLESCECDLEKYPFSSQRILENEAVLFECL